MSLAQQYDTLQQPGRSNLRDLHHALDGAVSEAYSFTEDEDLSPSSLRVNKDLAADPDNARGPGMPVALVAVTSAERTLPRTAVAADT